MLKFGLVMGVVDEVILQVQCVEMVIGIDYCVQFGVGQVRGVVVEVVFVECVEQ